MHVTQGIAAAIGAKTQEVVAARRGAAVVTKVVPARMRQRALSGGLWIDEAEHVLLRIRPRAHEAERKGRGDGESRQREMPAPRRRQRELASFARARRNDVEQLGGAAFGSKTQQETQHLLVIVDMDVETRVPAGVGRDAAPGRELEARDVAIGLQDRYQREAREQKGDLV